MPGSPAPPFAGSAGSPASLSKTVKQSDFLSPFPASRISVSTVKPKGLAFRKDTPSNPKAPHELAQLSPREQFARYYGFSLPPPPPRPDGDPVINYSHKVSSVAAPFPPPSELQLLAKFNEQFVHSQMRLRSVRRETPSSIGRFSLTPSNRRDVFTWVTLQQPSFTSRPPYMLLPVLSH